MNGIEINLQTYEHDDEIMVINLSGILDAEGAYSLDSILEPLVSKGSGKIICQMENVSFIASTGIGVLLSNTKNIRENKGDITLIGVSEHLINIFKSLDLLNYFSIFQTAQEAANNLKLTSLKKEGPQIDETFMDIVTNVLSGDFNDAQLNALQMAIDYRQISEEEELLGDSEMTSLSVSERITNHLMFINKMFTYLHNVPEKGIPIKELLIELLSYLNISDLYFYMPSLKKGIGLGSGDISEFDFSKNIKFIDVLKQKNKIYNINDVAQSYDEENLIIAMIGCEIVVPINLQEKVVGFIFLGSKELGAQYTKLDIELLRSLTSIITSMIKYQHSVKTLKR